MGQPRIVSLVPSLTELLCELGLAEALVGRTGFCVHPREVVRRIPKVGGTKSVKIDKVRELDATHVVVNIDENRREDVDQLAKFIPHVIVTHPLTADDNIALYRLLGALFRREAQAEELATRFEQAACELSALARGRSRERVLYLIWREPWMTVARDTYISATLALAGWDTLPENAATRYPQLNFDEAWLKSIERVLLPSEPYVFREKHLAEVAALPGLAGKPIQLLDGEMVSWYGSRAIAGMRYLASLRQASLQNAER